ncbi:MAG: RDD family protein [Acidobacteria bacterium]|nr:RDD family protein [Acidobacteriota bacterium]
MVRDFLDRDLVRTEAPPSSLIEQAPEHQESAPTEPARPEAEPFVDPHPGVREDVESTRVAAPLQSGAATVPTSQGTLFSDNIQRIEIKLNQSPLPFGESNSRDDLLGDSIHQELRSATVRDRFGAGILDTLMVVGCWLIFSLVVIAFTDFKVLSLSAGLGLGLVFLSIGLSYFFLFTVLSARTPGMDTMGLAVMRFDGELPSFRDVGLRIFGYCISAGCFGLGFLWACFDAERLTWHDRISRTLVIESAPPPGD